MRTLVRSIRRFNSVLRHQGGNHAVSLARRRYLVDQRSSFISSCTCEPIQNQCLHKYARLLSTVSGSLPADAEQVLSGEVNKGSLEGSKGGPLVEYARRIAAGELLDGDLRQIDTLKHLQRLYDELVEKENECRLDRYATFEKSTRPSNWRKKRIHFHDFMLNVHSRLQRHRGVADPLEVVAGEISDDSILLCLDEFMVTDVADALILNRLFSQLFSNGVILVTTSNRAPDNLYEGGLQRDLFLPFIATLKERCVVHEIGSSVDYRKMTSGQQGFYLVGLELSGLLKAKFQQLIGEHQAEPHEVEVVMGRKLKVPLGADGCAYFPFEELCDRPLGAADYSGLFSKFHTLALDGVPIFGVHNRTAAYRFVTLVDVMYENRARLMCTAEGSPYELFERIVTISEAQQLAPRSSSRSRKKDDLDLCVDNELGFAKDRTISRLTEMNSKEYLEHHAAMLAEKRRKQEEVSSHK